MNEWELLKQLQVITDKLKNKESLNDNESKLFTTVILYLGFGIASKMFKLLYDKLEGDNDE